MIPSRLTKPVLATVLAALLCACALGGGGSRFRVIDPQVTVDVEALSDESAVVAVGRPQADGTRDSSRILVRRGRQLLPWPEAAWVDRAPDLVQGLAVATLDGRLATVARHGTVPSDYRIDLDLRRFELVERPGGLTAEFVMGVRLRDASGALLGTTTISAADHRAEGRSLDAAMSAMESALGDGLSRLAAWMGARLEDEAPGDS